MTAFWWLTLIVAGVLVAWLTAGLCKTAGEADDAMERWADRWIEEWNVVNRKGGDW